jgi:hypothetical protein
MAVRTLREIWKNCIEIRTVAGDSEAKPAGGIACTFITGNHDYDLRFATERWYHRQHKDPVVKLGLGDGCGMHGVRIEHGHFFDKNNTTEGIHTPDKLNSMYGKRLTWQYVSNQRGEGAEHAKMTSFWAPRSKNIEADDNMIVASMGAASYLHPWTATKAAESVDYLWGVRQATREGVFQAIVKEVQKSNGLPNVLFFDRIRDAFNIPCRLWIHAHTHSPAVKRVNLMDMEVYTRAADAKSKFLDAPDFGGGDKWSF